MAKSESIATYTELWLSELTTSRAEKRLCQDQTLPLGTILKDTYLIERILSGGGQGTAYLAQVLPSSGAVIMPPHLVIKEFIMPDNERGLKKATDSLVKEAAILRRINNPLIVKIYDFFMECTSPGLSNRYETAMVVLDVIRVMRRQRQAEAIAEP